ncbi:hypothetical protein IAE35_02105 [Pseudomonas sp. S75]|uniref:hypothetical protein n=1 Tax=unclassified Pseudomonas TaxID=196821 RepID=UPI001903835F|nr:MULTISPECIES: hypothetical protein [unclassified Pseudomonas]MBJ9973950.1 hypothetical protein [Pseudomonas sp. S30]MBK0152120.1 hypothetical protein [Pseudomonas sp. S75]
MSTINVVSVIGSAVPAKLREQGLLVCWYLVRNGEPLSGPMPSRLMAQTMADQLESAVLTA